MKKISIITVVKNGLPFLRSAIRSIKKQSIYSDIEHIVVCSPSSDGTEKYLESVDDIKLIFDNNSKNKFEALNIGIQNASTDKVGLLHADDIFSSEFIVEKISKNLNSENDVIYGDISFCDKNNLNIINREWKSSEFNYKKLEYGWMPPHTSIFLKKNIMLQNLYQTSYPISGDYNFILELFTKKKIKFKYLNETLVIMRTGGDSTNIKNFFKKLSEDRMIVKKFFSYSFKTVIFKILRKINQLRLIKKKINSKYIIDLENNNYH